MTEGKSQLYIATSWALWPWLFVGGLVGAGWAFSTGAPLLWFNVVYLTIVALIAGFERLMPYERQWLKRDGEALNDIAHTLLSKGGVQIAAAIGASAPMAVATVLQPSLSSPLAIWPHQWPLALQVVLGLTIAEFGLYVAHRAAHEILSLWRFHALHHSVERLWVVNTGRFHIVDSLFKIALSQLPLYLMGAPLPVFLWIGAVTAFIGLLTHCNMDVTTGPLDWVFSTPRLHRWHHSKVLAEGNTNYGENLVLWDQIFGTYFNPPRRPPVDIGISGRVAEGFLGQLVQPFSAKGFRQILGRRHDRPVPVMTANEQQSHSEVGNAP
ncbi:MULTISPECIES: sterol desaturase family protein [unclassified Rhizobium]|uniref:sterol desaturase family protein n=1 Tax=unclassified Rhizobium TaxID=2613769 RepID=UPI001611B467|nr:MULTISPECIES: sterol desaturase family protein [unclassified Rhizobium]MBB3545000.1 sterol desaturase/sphingolipid hydroxylase (fatty acid hydroxylase superfamily) [Rhizobium sp. BK399]MCS3742936.1 sterol desaturase/sphingolipid hydroxylase (fatty acid hydroxylase superfamily) [Rhizobium sp. BK661]MCS4095596.1 sterol desaturase/sphingolipid hydroxylase (fatty acid hydroxylase superfamily) [Rhizobium sp. BK176]